MLAENGISSADTKLPDLELGRFQSFIREAWEALTGHLVLANVGGLSLAQDRNHLKSTVSLGPLCVVAVFPTSVAAGIAREIFGCKREDFAELDPLIYDFIGEFVNVIAGRIAGEFEANGIDIGAMGVPARTLATRMQDVRTMLAMVRMTSDFGPIWVSLEAP
jgi:hypothetical protein